MYLFRQTLKDVENIYKDVAAYDMKNLEFKGLGRKASGKNFNYL